MKATLIISTEYKHNRPSVFIFADGQYYGCLIYPRGRNFPTDMDYWKTATCADADRYFTVKEVEYPENSFNLIKNLQEKIKETEKCMKQDNANPYIARPNASKNSKIYKDYLAKKEAQEAAQREIWQYNQQFYNLISECRNKITELILSALPDEN